MVQQELYPPDERPQGDGDPGQPHADAAPARLSEALTSEADLDGIGALHTEQSAPEAHSLFTHAEDLGDAHVHQPASDSSIHGLVGPPHAAVEPAPDSTYRWQVIKEELLAWFRTLTSAAVYATLIVTFGFQIARVEGLSMAPTLEDQDRLVVNKLAYRLGSPRRGDIVMLYYPINPDKSFVKRVIAEENDEVRIVEGRVYVNDVPLPDDFVPPEYQSHDDYQTTRVPEGYYFVMGDHRNNSSDSRHWGMVPKKYIIGRVQVRWWPIPHARVFPSGAFAEPATPVERPLH